MKDTKTKVYVECLNENGAVAERFLIAEFCSEKWADTFIEDETEKNRTYLGFSRTRYVKEREEKK